jgi:hypothetical protein
MAWLPLASTTVEPARSDIARWAGGGIIRSSVATRYQLGLTRHAGSVTDPLGGDADAIGLLGSWHTTRLSDGPRAPSTRRSRTRATVLSSRDIRQPRCRQLAVRDIRSSLPDSRNRGGTYAEARAASRGAATPCCSSRSRGRFTVAKDRPDGAANTPSDQSAHNDVDQAKNRSKDHAAETGRGNANDKPPHHRCSGAEHG